jgi:hypothetical protein
LELYLKVQNNFESPKHLHKTTFKTQKYLQKNLLETAYFGECLKNLSLQKSSPKCCNFFGLLNLFKRSQMTSKSCPIGKKFPNLVTLQINQRGKIQVLFNKPQQDLRGRFAEHLSQTSTGKLAIIF